jgi:hypothetical protein
MQFGTEGNLFLDYQGILVKTGTDSIPSLLRRLREPKKERRSLLERLEGERNVQGKMFISHPMMTRTMAGPTGIPEHRIFMGKDYRKSQTKFPREFGIPRKFMRMSSPGMMRSSLVDWISPRACDNQQTSLNMPAKTLTPPNDGFAPVEEHLPGFLSQNGEIYSEEKQLTYTKCCPSCTSFDHAKRMLDAWGTLSLRFQMTRLPNELKRLVIGSLLGQPPSKQQSLYSHIGERNSISICNISLGSLGIADQMNIPASSYSTKRSETLWGVGVIAPYLIERLPKHSGSQSCSQEELSMMQREERGKGTTLAISST